MGGEFTNFYNPFGAIERWQNRLPHWQQAGVIVFLTCHLGDAVPVILQRRWQEERDGWLALHPRPWTPEGEVEYHRRFSAAKDRYLDTGHGSCLFRSAGNRAALAAALQYFDDQRCRHLAWVLMPNHFHALFICGGDWPLAGLVKSWKQASTLSINRRTGRTGSLWQKDYFDRLIRDSDHLTNCLRYIRRNPEKARLREGEFTHFESALAADLG